MEHRIGIVGASGTGKSRLARTVAGKLMVPVLESKFITSEILRREGYDYSSGIQIERFLAHTGSQNEMLTKTIEMEDNTGEFVTDRTVVDFAAYAMLELNSSDTEVLESIYSLCMSRAKEYSHIFVCPMDGRVESNSRRTLNVWYQFLIQTIIVGLLEKLDCDYTILSSNDTEERVCQIMDTVT